MIVLKQNLFDQFKCIAQLCPESCCKFWQIVPDEDAMERYDILSGKDQRIRDNIEKKEGVIRAKNGICAFLDPDELCYLQKTYGEKMLCDTCRDYPRHTEEFENVREYTLSLSCPEAARMLLLEDQPFEIHETEDEKEEFFEDFDCLLYDKLLDARKVLLTAAKDRTVPLLIRMSRICALSNGIQELIDQNRIFEIDGYLEESVSGQLSPAIRVKDDTDFETEKRSFQVLYDLEHFHAGWIHRLDQTWNALFDQPGVKDFPDSFLHYVKDHEIEGEKILLLLLFTYFCGAVYDGWVRSKTYLCVYIVRWIFYISFAHGANKDSLIRAAYQTAREIEHSDINLDALEEWFMKNQ